MKKLKKGNIDNFLIYKSEMSNRKLLYKKSVDHIELEF